MGSKERKQPHRWYLLFLSESAATEQTHQNDLRFFFVWFLSVCFGLVFKSQNMKSRTKECMFPQVQKQEVAVGRIYVHALRNDGRIC